MIRLWRYIYYDPITETVEIGREYKEPEIWSEEQPKDPDYKQVTGEEYRERFRERNFELAVERKEVGERYCARLSADFLRIVSGLDGNEKQITNFRRQFYGMYRELVQEIVTGKWYEAQSIYVNVEVPENLLKLIDNRGWNVDAEEFLQEIKDRIDKVVENLY